MTSTTDEYADLRIDTPGTPGYERDRAVYALAALPAPAEAVTVADVEATVAAVRYARDRGWRIAVLATGHGAERLPRMTGSLLIRTAFSEAVVVDVERRRARVPAGRTWGEVVAAASPHGLVALHGSSPGVGVVGFLLSGGLSFHSRRFGVGSNSVLAAEIVTADGVVRRVDEAHDGDLFWAVRGGGAGLGVVTALEIELYPVGDVLTGAAFFSAEHAGELLRAWRDWAATAPRSVATTVRLLRFPPLPEIPPPLVGGQVVCVDGVAPAADSEATHAVAELRARLEAVAPTVLDTWHVGPPLDVTATHMDPPDPVPTLNDHALLAGLPDAAVESLVAACGPDSGSTLAMAELRQLGGALADPRRPGGYLDRIVDPWLLNVIDILPAEELRAPVAASLAAVTDALAPWVTGRIVPTFVARPDEPRPAVSPTADRLLQGIRQRVDPDGVFLATTLPLPDQPAGHPVSLPPGLPDVWD
ncbi:FAD-binding oxidoreductase [Jatrophihabitans sp. YIM 134969]